MARVQVITGVKPQRHWGQEQKRALVAAAFAPGAVVSEVARRADLSGGPETQGRRSRFVR